MQAGNIQTLVWDGIVIEGKHYDFLPYRGGYGKSFYEEAGHGGSNCVFPCWQCYISMADMHRADMPKVMGSPIAAACYA